MEPSMREKTVDEAVGTWLVTDCVSPKGYAYIESVGCHTTDDYDIFSWPIPKPVAEEAVKLHDEFRKKLYALFCCTKEV